MKDFLDKVKKDPFANTLGINIEKAGDGYALCSVVITEEMFNFLGVVHGGLFFTLADVAFSAASNSDHSPSYALDVSGSFLKTVTAGDTITAEARRIHSTKRTGVYRMDVKFGDQLLATFNGTVFRKV